MIYDDYIDYTDKYMDKYGPKTVVFMQVGDFFELYAVQNQFEQAGADIYKVAEICNIQVSRKNKAILENSRQNPLMAGFPIATISKFVNIMVQHGYTCVLVRQTTAPPTPKREVTEVISPATTLTVNTPESTYLMTIYWENITDHTTQRKYLSAGVALIDLTTAKSHVYEAYSLSSDPNYALDETHRIYCHYKPIEVVFLGDNLDSHLIVQLETLYRNTTLHTIWEGKRFHLYKHPPYQNSVLEKVFGQSLVTPIEMLQLEKAPLATIAYTYMIQFAYEHNETIVQKIEKPNPLNNDTHLILEATCAYQLNILSHHEQSLLALLDRTKTAFGARLYKERLLNPILSIDILEERYNQIEFFKNHYSQLAPLLASILDLERIIRRIGLLRLQPCEWVSLLTSLETAQQIYDKLNKPPLPAQIIQATQALNLEECGKYNLQDIYTSLFHKGYYPQLDTLQEELQSHFTALQAIATSLDPNNLCKLDCNERDGYFLMTTKKRWESIQQKPFTTKLVSPTSSNLRVTSPEIENHSNAILLLQRKISLLNIDLYKQFLATFYEQHASTFQQLVSEIAEIDVACSHARVAIEYNFHKPTLVSSPTSFITAKDLRHPIIERLSYKAQYVANDVHLDKSGMLLYGINASGKSSLMKSIGLAVIMAQAGMYVSGHITLSPYKHIFTRIASMDNIWRGLSTFTVEMLELKNILHRCDHNSLVLGDELCAGTEAVSGIAIVAAGIHELQKKQASFVFATHLHELLDVDLPPVTVMHLHIDVDNDGNIIYDRKLKPGSGSPLYGLEVCRFLQMPDTFLKKANDIRKKIQKIPPHLVAPKPSRYSQDIYVSQCELCGNVATETHHIQHQKDATSLLVHHPSNLVTLCEACHLKQHTGENIILAKVQTSQGPQLQISSSSSTDSASSSQTQTLPPLSEVLLYTIKGWFYRTTPTEKWKKTTPTAFKKLQKRGYPIPLEPDQLEAFLSEHQTVCMKQD